VKLRVNRPAMVLSARIVDLSSSTRIQVTDRIGTRVSVAYRVFVKSLP